TPDESLQPSSLQSSPTFSLSRLTRSIYARFTPSMPPASVHSTGTGVLPLVFVLALFPLIGTACTTTGSTGKILYDNPRGTVSLQTISDRSIQANHPITLDQALLAQLLSGIALHDEGSGEHHVKGVISLLTGKDPIYPLFSEDEVQFLAP